MIEAPALTLPQKSTVTPKSILKIKYIPSLDGFRAISILMVIYSHICIGIPDSPFVSHTLDFGYCGVTVFFIISGFLITTLLIKEKERNGYISLQKFYIRRALRILPVAYLYLIVLFILNRIFNMSLAFGNFFRPAVFIENFGAHDKFYKSGHYWSLSVEEQYYLIFPFILVYLTRNYVKITYLILLTIPVFSIAYFHVNSNILQAALSIPYHVLGMGLSSIIIGSLSAIFLIKRETLPKLDIKLLGAVQIISLVIAFKIISLKLFLGIGNMIGASLIAAVIISSICNTSNSFYKLLNYKPVKYIGTLSYSLYIWQQIFTAEQPWAKSASFSNSILLNLTILFIVAYISYEYYEKQFLKLKSRFETR